MLRKRRAAVAARWSEVSMQAVTRSTQLNLMLLAGHDRPRGRGDFLPDAMIEHALALSVDPPRAAPGTRGAGRVRCRQGVRTGACWTCSGFRHAAGTRPSNEAS